MSQANLFRLTDRTIVLTGGLGLLGKQFTTALVGSGARVAVLDTRAAETSDYEAVWSIPVDVADAAQVRDAWKKIADRWGAPTGLINAAAIDFPPQNNALTGTFEGNTAEQWDLVSRVNTNGVLVCSQVFGAAMAAEDGGSIVNIGSIYGLVSPDHRIYPAGFTKPISYTVTKAAMLGITKYLATYWATAGVRVNTLVLGGVEANQSAEFQRRYADRVPLRRMARPDEYGGAVVFLLSDASSYMTGTELVMDGGLTAI